MNEIPLFDANAHPTLNGGWPRPREACCDHAGLKDYVKDMGPACTERAIVVGLAGHGGYDEEKYAKVVVSASKRLVPVAYLSPDELNTEKARKNRLSRLSVLGFRGIKFHLRLSGGRPDDPRIGATLAMAGQYGLFGMVCTLFQGAGAPVSFDALGAMLDRAGDAKVILVHACGARLLEVRELVAPFPNVLLDLSYTMFRYEGSSLDLDMRWLLANFDRRTCVGTDYPYRDLKALRARFRSLSSGLPAEKVKNVSYYNLQAFVEGVS